MSHIRLSGAEARRLAEESAWLADAGKALSELSDDDPALAREAGVEVAALEAKILLGTGAVERVLRAAALASRSPAGAPVAQEDLGRLTRLEAVVSSARARIERRLAEAEAKNDPGQKVMGAVSLAGGILSLAKQIF